MIEHSIRAVYFDAVGTLLFPRVRVAETYREHARRHRIELNEAEAELSFREAFVRQERLDSENGWSTSEDRERARWRTIVGDVLGVAFSEACFADLWQWFSGQAAWRVNFDARDVLDELANRKLVLGIASNFDSRLIGLLAQIPELSPLEKHCVISSIVGWRKPAPEFFAAIVQDAQCRPNEIVYVGDDPRNDIQGATSAGLRAILFDSEGTIKDGLRIRNLRDLLTSTGVFQ